MKKLKEPKEPKTPKKFGRPVKYTDRVYISFFCSRDLKNKLLEKSKLGKFKKLSDYLRFVLEDQKTVNP